MQHGADKPVVVIVLVLIGLILAIGGVGFGRHGCFAIPGLLVLGAAVLVVIFYT